MEIQPIQQPIQTIINYNCLNINTLEKSKLILVIKSKDKKRKINKSEIQTNSLDLIELKLGLSEDMIIKLNNKSYNISRIFLLCSDYFEKKDEENIFNIKYIKINFDKLKKISFIQRLSCNNIELLLNEINNIYIFYLNDDDLDENNYNTLINIGFVKDTKIQL